MISKKILIFLESYWEKVSVGPIASLQLYWHGYGRSLALFSSFYFWVSIILSIITGIINLSSESPWQWQSDVISVIPTIFGFTLGGFAIIVGFGNEDFRNKICSKEQEGELSIYIKVNSSIFHFIFVQFICLFYCIITKALKIGDYWPFYFLGLFLFFYALLTIIATGFAVLRLAKWFDSIYPNK